MLVLEFSPEPHALDSFPANTYHWESILETLIHRLPQRCVLAGCVGCIRVSLTNRSNGIIIYASIWVCQLSGSSINHISVAIDWLIDLCLSIWQCSHGLILSYTITHMTTPTHYITFILTTKWLNNDYLTEVYINKTSTLVGSCYYSFSKIVNVLY